MHLKNDPAAPYQKIAETSNYTVETGETQKE